MIATPGFWIGILLLILLGVKVHLFPVGGAGKSPRDWPYYLFLPALTLALHVAAVLTRNLRDSLLTMMDAEHVLVARAKGLDARRVMLGHVLRNAMISTVTLFGLYIGYLVGGSVIIESVFALARHGEHDRAGDPRPRLSGGAGIHADLRHPRVGRLSADRHRVLVRRSARITVVIAAHKRSRAWAMATIATRAEAPRR